MATVVPNYRHLRLARCVVARGRRSTSAETSRPARGACSAAFCLHDTKLRIGMMLANGR